MNMNEPLRHTPIHQGQQGNQRFAELDGLRALAVVAVILFHCELSGVFDNGLYGVDMFFAISGFIITAMLAKEFRENGDFRFGAFYFRRLKRLLPPVLALLLLGGFTAFISHDAYHLFRTDVPAALAYVSNFWQIDQKQSYFDSAPRILRHLWSLSVEEQFYMLWPPVAYGLIRRFGVRVAGMAALGLALASTLWMWQLFEQSGDSASINRIYLGTDSHAMGLFLGAALACFWNPWTQTEASPARRNMVRAVALAALAALLWMMCAMDPASSWKYRGSFLLVPALTAILAYGTLTDPAFLLSRLLRNRFTQWLGTRSYSLYLVHWLVFSWIRLFEINAWPRAEVLAASLVLVAALSELMYRWVEQPTRHMKVSFLDDRRMIACVCAYMVAALALLALTWPDTPPRQPEAAASSAPAEPDPATVTPPLAQAAVAGADDSAAEHDNIMAGGEDIFAIGDSVLLGAKVHLAKTIPGMRVDAIVGRQASEGVKVIKGWRAANPAHLASTVLVHLGTNGYINEKQYRELLDALADRKAVYLINVHAERRWTDPNNDIIDRIAPDYPNVHIVDWRSASRGHPQYFVKDGIHLTVKGMRALSAQIEAAVGGPLNQPGPPKAAKAAGDAGPAAAAASASAAASAAASAGASAGASASAEVEPAAAAASVPATAVKPDHEAAPEAPAP